MNRLLIALISLSIVISPALGARKKAKEEAAKTESETHLDASTFEGLAFRGIGPAVTSGRISDIAVDPRDKRRWFVAVASGGVFRTENAGVTFEPVFDKHGSYSIGCVAIAPSNSLEVWVGTGENNSQRSVGYGDGVYKSIDGGETFEKVGLESSEHIGKILVHPEDADIVYVASQGPLWAAGGDRGLYKTTDGGESWERVLEISEHTGVSDIAFDPRDPDIMYAVAYQRRRHVFTLINGGPESGLYKTTDGGESWVELERGLPKGDIGRIGIAVSPADPDVVYALVEARDEGGFYRSTNAGASWHKRGDYNTRSAQYYQELFADPEDVDRVYSMDTWMQVTEDGGKTFRRAGEASKHVDNHALWIDPDDTRHLIAGCDGGVYESFDRAKTWRFFTNLPVTQFYKVTVDNAEPFYNIYGGTQDNATLGGPSRTTSINGIVNSDWFVTVFGDGFKTVVDPEDPNIVYSQWQYGGLVRYDRRSGEAIDIQPQPGLGEPPLRWNWDSAIIISPHSSTRLYFGANKLFRSEDRGNSWRSLGGDLTRQIDRNKLPVMDKVWSVDAVAKNASTSFYGNIVALDESPLVEDLLYVGTDDGLIQVSEDGGETWTRVEEVPGVPEMTYVNQLTASLHDPDTVFAAFNNHKRGDFKPYLFKSTDRGRTWRSITGDLPDRGSTYSIVQDHVKPELLFAGTEFGVFFSVDGGSRWVQLKGGIPTIAARELVIQRRENDLVVGSFGRGFFVLDDFSPLRRISEQSLESEAILFPVKRTWMFIETAPLGLPGKAFQGEDYYTAPNPPAGAVFSYYLKDSFKTLKEARREREKQIEEDGGTIEYPTWDELRAEAAEEKPRVVLTVRDAAGDVVRRVTGPASKGFHRVSWDLRFPDTAPVSLEESRRSPWSSGPKGAKALPGAYSVSLDLLSGSDLIPLDGPVSFETVPLGLTTLAAEDKEAVLAFEKKVAELQRAAFGAGKLLGEIDGRLDHVRKALIETPDADPALLRRAEELEASVRELMIAYRGDSVVRGHNEPVAPGVYQRIQRIVSGQWSVTSAPTKTHRDNYEIAATEFETLLASLTKLVEEDLASLDAALEDAGAPWTPGRLPRWSR